MYGRRWIILFCLVISFGWATAALGQVNVKLDSAQTDVTFDKFKNRTRFGTGKSETGKVTYDGGKDLAPLVRDMKMVVGFSCAGDVRQTGYMCTPDTVE